jgi:hypothetical protein
MLPLSDLSSSRALSINPPSARELLNGEVFYTLRKAQVIIDVWWRHYNTIRPHISLATNHHHPEVFMPAFVARPAALRRPAPPGTLASAPALN